MTSTALLTLVVLLLLTGLEIAVAMIQAHVFTLLLSLYLQENVKCECLMYEKASHF